MELGEIGTTALLLAVLVAGWLLGRWHRGRVVGRLLAARLAVLEEETERLRVEVDRIDATALLWHPPVPEVER
jgi:hypothetical protein